MSVKGAAGCQQAMFSGWESINDNYYDTTQKVAQKWTHEPWLLIFYVLSELGLIGVTTEWDKR